MMKYTFKDEGVVNGNIEENEELVDNFLIFKIEPEVLLAEDDIVVTGDLATGKLEITISLKVCVAWVICTDIYNETTEYSVDFQKDDGEWKIVSMIED